MMRHENTNEMCRAQLLKPDTKLAHYLDGTDGDFTEPSALKAKNVMIVLPTFTSYARKEPYSIYM